MAQWKETLEPYIKVYERIRTTTIVPTAGEDLIIGATIISDSGPSYPVLITSQREFLNTFASQEITKSYIDSLDNFYKDEDKESPDKLASTMWLNAYRLAGSTNMLIVRATKGADMNYVVPVGGSDESQYIVRDGQLLQRVTDGFSLTLDRLGANANNKESGWAISVNEIGIIGNLVSDEGPVYEYFAANLRELVEYLNSTSKFFCPNPKYYIFKTTTGRSPSYSFDEAGPDDTPDMVYFKEVYLAENFIDPNGFKKWYDANKASDALGNSANTTSGSDQYGTKLDGLAYLLATKGDNHNYTYTSISTLDNIGVTKADIVDPNDLVNFTNIDDSYFVNTYNSNTDIKIRIRKFNHDAVILKENVKPTVSPDGESPYEVLPDVIRQFNLSTEAQKARIAERDFFEVAVFDPSLDKDPLSFCVGNIPGRGDITLDELNDTLKMINLHLDSMYDLGLEYFNPSSDDLNVSYGRQVALNSHLPAGSGNAGRFMPVTSMNTSDWGNLVGSGSLPVFFADEDIPSPASMGGKGNYNYIVYFPNVTRAEALSASNTRLQLTAEKDIQGNYIFKPYVDDGLNTNLTTIIVKYANLPATVSDLGKSIQILEVLQNELITDPGDYQVRGFNFSAVSGPDSNGEITLPKGDGGEGGGEAPEIFKRGGSGDDENTITGILLQWVPSQQVYKELGINIIPGNSNSTELLTVTPDDLMRSISSITEDEVYTTEGLTDLGNTNLKFQTYLCNMAKNENYFYPISTLYSTNYLAIANYRTRLNQDSHKLYTSAPWDIDSGTVGFKFHASPSVIYWEAVSRNRSMNREFASVFGFSSNGQVLYSNPVTEFTKKQRQLLLSRQINTVMWNTQNQTWNMNDCYTMTSENHILNEDGNSRLFIRINKAIPTLLRPLIGRKLNNSTYADAETILKYWFERTILTMQYSVSDYKVTIANLEANDDQARRQNKMYVLVECLFARSLKYVIVYSDALDMGMEFVGEIV